jgi:hypothetical protein
MKFRQKHAVEDYDFNLKEQPMCVYWWLLLALTNHGLNGMIRRISNLIITINREMKKKGN